MLIAEYGGDIPDKEWNMIIEEIENEYRDKIKEVIPKAFWFSLFKIAEEGNCIIEIDGIDIGAKIRSLRRIYDWIKQKKQYFGW